MRMVMFKGRAVRRQHRTKDGLSMIVHFYEKDRPLVVSLEEWHANVTNVFYDDEAPRSEVASRISRASVSAGDTRSLSELQTVRSGDQINDPRKCGSDTRIASLWVIVVAVLVSLLALLGIGRLGR